MNLALKKITTISFYLYCFIILIRLIYNFIYSIKPEIYLKEFNHYGLCEWLINYEGGFVRRGFCGEILFYLYQFTNVNIGLVIYILSYCMLFVFLYIFIKEWKKYQLSAFMLPSVCLMGAFTTLPLILFRRDILIFILIWYIFKNYRLFLSGKKVSLLYIYIISTISILSHEAVFFYFALILGFHYLFYLKQSSNLKKSIIQALLFMLPIIFVMFLCIINKGNYTTANDIWHSWDPYFISEFGKTIPMGEACEALSWNSIETFKMHFTLNYLDKTFGVYRFLLWPFIFIAIYYLLTNLNKIKIGIRRKECNNKEFCILNFSKILILQFIFLLPMFTILSCDFLRVISYWSISSFLFYFALGKDLTNKINWQILSKFTISLNNIFSQTNILRKRYIYILIFILLMIPFSGFEERDALLSSVPGNIYIVLKTTLEYIYEF